MDTFKKFCFCTLAVGNRYRHHARILAQDIQQHIPGTSLCVLTDKPEYFQDFPHVLAFKHHIQSVKGYHDKRFVIKKSLSLFESCTFLDSDVRIIGPAIQEINLQAGITAKAGCNLLKHLSSNIKDQKQIQVIEEVAQKLNIDLQKVQWWHEFMFSMKGENGLEKEFFQMWQTISYLFELRGVYDAEGCVMGLAAEKIGMTVRFEREDKFPVFKDNIERYKIQKGQSNLADKQIYFDLQKEIEYPKRTIFKKVIDKLTAKAVFMYRLLRLRKLAKNDPDFYKFFGIKIYL
ncbi:MAG: hypothetical protein EAZ76_08555 [Nostocales cyanobacterium]|nr:MAG: hypothetical protein EAZ76_08555 [Nostocales cyanobacterium]